MPRLTIEVRIKDHSKELSYPTRPWLRWDFDIANTEHFKAGLLNLLEDKMNYDEGRRELEEEGQDDDDENEEVRGG